MHLQSCNPGIDLMICLKIHTENLDGNMMPKMILKIDLVSILIGTLFSSLRLTANACVFVLN